MGDQPYVMTTAECWQLLHDHEFGRLAFRVVDEQHITPINYAVDGLHTDRPTILFRSAPGTKLLGVALGAEVAFEVDQIVGESAASVVVRGRARLLEEDEAHRAEEVPLRPWVDPPKYNVVEIVPESIEGRRFDLNRPWLHLAPSP